jgi:hypothetical protein
MSTTGHATAVTVTTATATTTRAPLDEVMKGDRKESVKNYKGFVAGVFSGISKLTGQCCCYPWSKSQ